MAYPNGASADHFATSIGQFAGSSGADTIIGTNASDTIDGGAGDDVIDGGVAADLVFGGKGDDTLIWNPGGGSDTVDGGAGTDTLAFNGANISEVITLSGSAGHVALTRDIGLVSMDITGVERIAFTARGGADLFVVGDLTATDVRLVDIDLGAFAGGGGDSQSDTIAGGGDELDNIFTLTTIGGVTTVDGLGTRVDLRGAEAMDRLAISAGSGNDVLDVSALDGGIGVNFNGGEGDDALRIVGDGKAPETIQVTGGSVSPEGATVLTFVNGVASQANLTGVEAISVAGGAAGDSISASALSSAFTFEAEGGKGDDTIVGGRGADVLHGGDGDDLVIWNPGDGSDAVDGGSDTDTLSFNVANVSEIISMIATDGHAILTRNIGSVTMDLDSVEHVTFQGGGGGEDVFFLGDMSSTDVRQVDVDLGAVADAAVDSVSTQGSAAKDKVVITGAGGSATVESLPAGVTVTHAEAADRLVVNTLDGDDTLDVTGFQGGMSLTLWGGNGSDQFVFGPSAGANVVILDFQTHSHAAQADRIELDAFPDRSFADAIAHSHIVQSGADVVISDDAGAIVTLRNTLVADLGESDFLFG